MSVKFLACTACGGDGWTTFEDEADEPCWACDGSGEAPEATYL